MAVRREMGVGWAYHVLLNLFTKPLHVLRRPISQRLSKVPSRPLAQLTLLAAAAATAATKRLLALDGLLDAIHDDALLDQRARRTRLEPAGEDVPAGGAGGHLELEVLRAVDELEHRVRRVVPLPASVLVDAGVPARTVRVARRERLEDLGRERGLEEEGGGLLPRRVRAAFPQGDDLFFFFFRRLSFVVRVCCACVRTGFGEFWFRGYV